MFSAEEIESGFNFSLGVVSTVACVVFLTYWWRSATRWPDLPSGSDRDSERFMAWMMLAIMLAMFGNAGLNGLLTPYYVARAAGDVAYAAWFREHFLTVANAWKGLIAIAGLMHVRAILQRIVGRLWPAAIGGIAAGLFLVGALIPRLL